MNFGTAFAVSSRAGNSFNALEKVYRKNKEIVNISQKDEIWVPRNEDTLTYTTKGLGKPHANPIMVITAPYDDPLIQLSINRADKI